MEDILKDELGLSWLQATGESHHGIICTGRAYDTDQGKIFVKHYRHNGAVDMFNGECASLQAIADTGVVKVPKYLKTIGLNDGSALLVLEYLKLKPLEKHAVCLGRKLAELHLSNLKRSAELDRKGSFVGENDTDAIEKFGFDLVTYNGHVRQTNTWSDDWLTFFVQDRLKPHIDLNAEKYGNRDVISLWPQVERNLSKLFPLSLKITPSLLHGDFWRENVAELDNEPVVFDPCCFYGHSEFDFAMSHVFGGFSEDFFDEYHKFVPKAIGFEQREKMYLLLMYLNHWNQIGPYSENDRYLEKTLEQMKYLANL